MSSEEEKVCPAGAPEPSSVRLIGTLAVAGVLSGIIIIAIYIATFDAIKENKARALRESVFRVLPNVTKMQKLLLKDDKLVVSYVEEKDEKPIYAGYDDSGKFMGYAIPSDGPGFADTIGVLYGYRPSDRKVIGMWILESRETPGLGDKIYKDAAFVAEFDDLAIEPPIKAVKKGKKTGPNEIDAITGATISSVAVAKIINKGNEYWVPKLQPGDEPAYVEPQAPASSKGEEAEAK
jgi:electron transport complex protein RnfG